MRASPRRTRREVEKPSPLAYSAYLHLTSRRHTTRTLAGALGVSTATAFRAIQELRAGGLSIDSVKRGKNWYFEVLDAAEREAAWKQDPLGKMIGFIRGPIRKAGETEDDVIYGRE
ncbi:MAG: HTH domain-containing protein [Planctomycetes bacterium]|nr:HTH domain-containing protein [Planctomycetota bacterium]